MTGPKRMRPESAEADSELAISYVVEPERRMSDLSVESAGFAVATGRRSARGNWHSRLRIGIMGGTFDPIHIGHLACAEQAREAFGLDAVVFIPAGKPAFKLKRDVTPAEQRFEMCRLAVRGNPAFDVSRIEIDRPGVTYTADTLRELREHYPGNVSLFFITGADAVCSILKWRESAAIASMAELIAATRPGYALSEETRLTIEQSGNFRIHMLETTGLAVSSSDLRARVRAGRSIRYLVMQRVLDYIAVHGLYAPEAAGEVRR